MRDKLTVKSHVFNTYWEDFDQWDGTNFYETLAIAKEMGIEDYVDYEYPDPDTFDEDEEYPQVGPLEWTPVGKFMWQLFDKERYTGVWIFQGPVLGLPDVSD